VRFEDVRGFVFDVDGTLVHRAGAEVRPLPGAKDVLDAIRESGRPMALFTNGSHMPPAAFARELREAGLPVDDDQVLTPLCSVQTFLERHGEVSVLPFVTDPARGYLEEAGVRLVDGGENDVVDVVFVAHPKGVDFESLELAARAAYAGANGPILSRGAMVTAAIAKASGRRPTIVGKPSRAAVNEIERRLSVPADEIAVIGDDLLLDVALGHLGRSRTVLVRSGISGSIDLERVPERRRPHLAVEGVGDLLDLL
jgi:HAD superfamily hydrolase (TIGR01450 family)